VKQQPTRSMGLGRLGTIGALAAGVGAAYYFTNEDDSGLSSQVHFFCTINIARHRHFGSKFEFATRGARNRKFL
jgi:hypothetical protein